MCVLYVRGKEVRKVIAWGDQICVQMLVNLQCFACILEFPANVGEMQIIVQMQEMSGYSGIVTGDGSGLLSSGISGFLLNFRPSISCFAFNLGAFNSMFYSIPLQGIGVLLNMPEAYLGGPKIEFHSISAAF